MKDCPKCKKVVPDEFDICWNCSYNFTSGKSEGLIEELNDINFAKSNIDCLRCKTPMSFEKQLKIHEGTDWGILGELGHLFQSKKSFDVYSCPSCGKVEFFLPE